jgi:hypothetical protein
LFLLFLSLILCAKAAAFFSFYFLLLALALLCLLSSYAFHATFSLETSTFFAAFAQTVCLMLRAVRLVADGRLERLSASTLFLLRASGEW